MQSVYIHIPFCKSICSYCDFCKMFYNPKWVFEYLHSLKEEIIDRYMGEVISTLYIGGGTPSCLFKKELEYLMDLTKLFKKDDNLEFTFECNLNDINEELLSILKNNGVNRLSIGVESFQERKLTLMGRNHTFEEAKEKMAMIRKFGFLNVNLDLIYGFYNETKEELKKDIQLLLSLNPEHISTYSLILSEHTLLSINQVSALDDDKDAELYEYICKKLKKKKFVHYEVSNFAKAGFESKHNLNYWNNGTYYGFGLSASGYIDGIRYTNTKNLNKYLSHQFDGEKDLLSTRDILDNAVMLGFRKIKGIDLELFKKTYGISLEEVYPVAPLLKNKELIQKNGYIFINPDKIYVMNEILMKLL